LLTEVRAVAFYQWLIVAPNVSRMGLYHDDFSLSHGIFTPPTTALAVLWHSFAIAIAFVTRKNTRLSALGLRGFMPAIFWNLLFGRLNWCLSTEIIWRFSASYWHS